MTAALLRPWRRTLALLSVALFLLWWVARTVTLSAVLAAFRELTPLELLALLVVNVLIFATFTGRWWVFLRAQGHAVAYVRLLAYRLTAFGISYFTPGPHFGGEPYQVYIVARRHGVPTADAVAAKSQERGRALFIGQTNPILTGSQTAGRDTVAASRAAPLSSRPVALAARARRPGPATRQDPP